MHPIALFIVEQYVLSYRIVATSPSTVLNFSLEYFSTLALMYNVHEGCTCNEYSVCIFRVSTSTCEPAFRLGLVFKKERFAIKIN
jgi:hypothetical protein